MNEENSGITPDEVPDSSLPEGSETMPCQMLDAILQIDDEDEAQEAMRRIRSPLDMDLEEAPSESDPSVNATEEPLPKGVSFNSIMNGIQKAGKGASSKLQYAAKELEQMDLLFDKVRQKVGVEQFTGFLALFSLASRKGNSGEKGAWEVTLNGRKIDAASAEFKVTFILKNDHEHRLTFSGSYNEDVRTTPKGDNVYRIGSTFCNNNFEIVVSPEFTRYTYHEDEARSYSDREDEASSPENTVTYQNIGETQYKTLDELADLLINEIYDTIQINNQVDWWTDKTLTVAEIVLTAAAICTGVGGALAVGRHVLIRAASVGLVVMESSNGVEAASRFLGVYKEGYNPLLEASRYLDKSAGADGHKFQAVFHGLNMVMAFGKKPMTRHLTALTSGAGTGAVYLAIADGGRQQTIESYETQASE